MDILTLLENSQEDIDAVIGNPLAQRGTGSTPYLGLQMMPERRVDQNQFTETRISYKTFVANNGTRFSTPQLKGGAYVGEFDVKLTSSDIKAQLTAMEYEAIIKILKRYTGSDVPMQALMLLLKWTDKQLVQPLVVKNERMVWECIIDALVQIEGDNGYLDPIVIPNPAGHRLASGDWDDDAYDPMQDIYGRADFLKSKDMLPNRQITSTKALNKLLRHPKVIRQARGFITVEAGALTGSDNRLTIEKLNEFFGENQLPPVQVYDKTYNVQGGAPRRFFKENAWVMTAETDTSEEINDADGELLEALENTLGYTAIGTNAGYDEPGRMVKTEAFDGKAPHIDGQAWQESLPVNQNPEAQSQTYWVNL